MNERATNEPRLRWVAAGLCAGALLALAFWPAEQPARAAGGVRPQQAAPPVTPERSRAPREQASGAPDRSSTPAFSTERQHQEPAAAARFGRDSRWQTRPAPPAPPVDPRARNLAMMAAQLEQNRRDAPFAEAAFKSGFTQEQEEKVVHLLYATRDMRKSEPALDDPASSDPHELARARMESVDEVARPLRELIGVEATQRYVPVAMRLGSTQEFGKPQARPAR